MWKVFRSRQSKFYTEQAVRVRDALTAIRNELIKQHDTVFKEWEKRITASVDKYTEQCRKDFQFDTRAIAMEITASLRRCDQVEERLLKKFRELKTSFSDELTTLASQISDLNKHLKVPENIHCPSWKEK